MVQLKHCFSAITLTISRRQPNKKRRLTFAAFVISLIILLGLLMGIRSLPVALADTNLASIPFGWGAGYYPDVPLYSFIDSDVTFNGETSIRLEQGGMQDSFGAIDRALWTRVITVSPGDTVYVSAWIQTDPSTQRDRIHGARIGVDFYVDTTVVDGLQSAYVKWGTSNWTLREIVVVIPSQLYSVDDAGTLGAVNGVSFWLQALNGNDKGSVWFAHTLFYVNPTTSISQPTPELTSTPSPSPEPSTPSPSPTQTPLPTKSPPQPTASPQATPTEFPKQTITPSESKTASPTYSLPITSPESSPDSTIFTQPSTTPQIENDAVNGVLVAVVSVTAVLVLCIAFAAYKKMFGARASKNV